MEKIAYNKLKFLIADDFSNFRSTVSDMLVQLGVIDIEMASNTDEIIELCSNNQFNVVLCDYNLGPGRNGQHVLEELRYKSYLRPRDIFILVSAEQSRNIVMSAYDCTPDDYLMKPITTQMLHTRLERILLQRIVLGRAYHAIENDNRSEAIDILIEISLAENRYSTQAQKILGELFIEVNELNKAEKLYRRALEVRELDWARLGLAKVKHLKGELDQAGEWLDKIIDENYLYLPAYDVLSRNWSRRGEKEKAQQVVQRSVDVSPMSILRQKRLAELAEENGDLESAVSALRKTVRLGKDSCHGEPKDVIKLSRTVARAIEEGVELSPASVQEAIQSLDEIEGFFELGQSDRINVALSKSRLFSATGEIDLARDCMDDVEAEMVWDLLSVDAALDQIRSLLSIGNKQQAVLLLELMQKKYAHNQSVLERLDHFFDEPVSESNKALVATVNREGIDLYNEGDFNEALECFERARVLFPKHVGLQLNIVQALIGKMKSNVEDTDLRARCLDSLETLSQKIDADDPQFKRYRKLKSMARNVLAQSSGSLQTD